MKGARGRPRDPPPLEFAGTPACGVAILCSHAHSISNSAC